MARMFLDTFVMFCILSITLLVQLIFWAKLSRRLKQSLSQVPGPWLARWSRIWIARALTSGRAHEIWIEVNSEFGSIARIGPNHILTDDPNIIRRILSVRSGYLRGPWFDSVRIVPHITNIVAERDAKKHGQIRAQLSSSFTGSHIAASESAMDQLVLEWIDTLRKGCVETGSHSCDIGQKIQFLTIDIITKVCFGDEIGCVKHDRDMYNVLETVEAGSLACQLFSVFLELNKVFFELSRIPLLRRSLFPNPCDKTGVGRVLGLVEEVTTRRNGNKYERRDVISSLLKSGMSKDQISSELVVALVAGSDSTSTSIQSTLLSIVTNPRVYNTLRAEIRSAVARRKISTPIQDIEAKQLAYLQACIFEGLRRFPPISQLRERVVPPGGDTLGRFHIPGGTFVGLNALGAQLNKTIYGDDADLYRPERWLTNDANKLKNMYLTHSLIFGHGSTKCLGASMAMMEIAKVIFELMRNFDICIANPYKPWLSKCYGIFIQKNFFVCLSPIDESTPPAYDHEFSREMI